MGDMFGGGKGGGGGGGGGPEGLGMGIMSYLGDVQANKNDRAVNATSSKWAPLLALNSSKGKADIPVRTANFGKTMGPALFNALGGGGPPDMGGGGGGGGGGGNPMEGMMMASQGGRVPGKSSPWLKMADGGQIPGASVPGPSQELSPEDIVALKNGGKEGGGGGGMMESAMKLAPMIAMMFQYGGGMIPGKAKVKGNSTKNDKVPVLASPGEGIVPRDVMENPNPKKVSKYLQAVKKNGPGSLPSPSGKKSSSINPWTAMCSGGKTR